MPLTLSFFQNSLTRVKLKTLPKPQTLSKCFDRHMCYVTHSGFIAGKVS